MPAASSVLETGNPARKSGTKLVWHGASTLEPLGGLHRVLVLSGDPRLTSDALRLRLRMIAEKTAALKTSNAAQRPSAHDPPAKRMCVP